jgi:hypothetical protein
MAKRNASMKRKKAGKKQSNGLFSLTFILVAIAAWVAIFVVGLFVNSVRRAIQGVANTYDRLSATSPFLATLAVFGVVVALIGLLAGIAWIAALIVNRRQTTDGGRGRAAGASGPAAQAGRADCALTYRVRARRRRDAHRAGLS